MSISLSPQRPSRLVAVCTLLVGLILAAVWLENRSPGVLPLLAVAGCVIFHWFAHGRHAEVGDPDPRRDSVKSIPLPVNGRGTPAVESLPVRGE